MYTLGAGLGVVALYALSRIVDSRWQMADGRLQMADGRLQMADGKWQIDMAAHPPFAIRHSSFAIRHSPFAWWLIYIVAAAAGMYTLYYFVFLLIPLNLWTLAVLIRRRVRPQLPASSSQLLVSSFQPPASRFQFPAWLLANLAAILLYAPWLSIAYRQVVTPAVPPWRTAPNFWAAFYESWTALSLGQSAPDWLWPVLLLTLLLYRLGLLTIAEGGLPIADCRLRNAESTTHHAPRTTHYATGYLLLATFGPLLLILAISAFVPLYHVRYIFTYSPAFYVVLAVGFAWLWRKNQTLRVSETRRVSIARAAAVGAALGWLVASAITVHAFWYNPLYRSDDHRAAVRFLQERWRPGDVVLVNAGWAYTALTTYWNGPLAFRGRLTDALPAPRADASLMIVTTGHVDGDTGLGWANPRSDFFALPADVAERQVASLFERFPRVWHYRIYDTVNDPAGRLRGWLAGQGTLFEDRAFAGEANMRVQGFVPRRGTAWSADLPAYRYAAGVSVQFDPAAVTVASGGVLYGSLTWRADAAGARPFAASLRLVGPDGDTWAQPPDERPLGPQFGPDEWPVGVPQRQPFAVPIPEGTPPGEYTLALLVYDPTTGTPWPPQDYRERLVAVRDGLNLGRVTVGRPQNPAVRSPLARFGPLALAAVTSPATVIAPGGQAPVELLWQAASAPGEPFVVVVQLLGPGDRLAASLEEQPVHGLYPTDRWIAGELVCDHHTLGLPADIPPGEYRLIVGVYRAADRSRLKTPAGLFAERDHWVVKQVKVGPAED
jgi:hypothetical protein